MSCSHFNMKTNTICDKHGYIFYEKDCQFYCRRHLPIKDALTTSCPICFENFGYKQYHIVLKCNHAFHKKCFDEWLSHGGDTCPICRASLYEDNNDESSSVEENYDIDEINLINMTNEEAVNALVLYFREGYSIPNNTFNTAMSIINWSFESSENY